MTNINVINTLKTALADSYILFIKTQNYHWNVTGHNFKSLHSMFEGQYTDLFTAIDLIAERIRALGEKAPGSYKEFIELTNITESNHKKSADEMVADLAKDQNLIVESLNKVFAAHHVGDEVTATIVTDRIEIHQKNQWMLESSLKD